jgi:hypothetical protein
MKVSGMQVATINAPPTRRDQRVERWLSALSAIPWLLITAVYTEACVVRLVLSRWPRPMFDDRSICRLRLSISYFRYFHCPWVSQCRCCSFSPYGTGANCSGIGDTLCALGCLPLDFSRSGCLLTMIPDVYGIGSSIRHHG